VVTCVFFHAHPDDESLLTAGTMARLAAEGHRVVLVVATSGESGLTTSRTADLGAVRADEVRRSAAVLGCDRVVLLGYPDSGMAGSDDGFCSLDPRVVARRLAELLLEERAGMLTSYDPNGGYGHPDHRQVNRVATRAAAIAGTRILLEATVDRRWYGLAVRAARLRGITSPMGRAGPDVGNVFSSRHEITHRVDVRAWIDATRASMAAHVSQASGDGTNRTLAALLALPRPLFALTRGTECYVRRGLPPGARMSHPLEEW